MERYTRYEPDWDSDPVLKALCVVGRGYWYHDIGAQTWIFHPPWEDHDEVIDLVSGIANTVSAYPPSARGGHLGSYLMANRKVMKFNPKH